MQLPSKLPRVGTTIFTVMSRLAAEKGAVNLGQGFPDEDGPAELIDAAIRALKAGPNQYAPVQGVPELRKAIARSNKRFYDLDIDWESETLVTAGAMHGLLEALDPQSGYLAPQEYAEYRKRADRPAKGDVGLALSKRFGYAAVVSVLPDSSAARAGVHAGDIIENIGGFTTREMSAGHARMLLAGDLDTSVRISVLRSGRTEPQDIDLVRVAPVVPRLAFEKLSLPGAAGADSGVAYLRVPSFGAGRAEELRARLTRRISLQHPRDRTTGGIQCLVAKSRHRPPRAP